MTNTGRVKTDAALLGMARGFRSGILSDGSSDFMCLAICAPLQSLLYMEGVETDLIKGWVDCGTYYMDHVWLRLKDGRVLDPTADQLPFSLPPVYLGEQPTPYHINE